MAKIRELNPARNKKLIVGGGLHYLEYKNLLMNAITITTLNNENINYDVEVFIKNSLIENGAVGYDKLTKKWANVYGEGLNELGNPTILNFRFRNGKSFRRNAYYDNDPMGSYIIDALPITYALADLIKETTSFIDNCNVAINQNIDACKTPYIVVAKDSDLQYSIKTAIQEKQDGAPVIVVSEDLGEALKSVNVNVEYIADKIEMIKTEWRDKLLNKLGIMSANTDKRERVQVGEVNATVGQCSDYIYLLIDTFNKQCETYGLDYKMQLNGALEELYTGDEYVDNENMEGDKII